MSYISNLNKKNSKNRNTSLISQMYHNKLNISNLIAETQRIISSTNQNKIHNQQISNINLTSPMMKNNISKGNKVINDLYRSYSTNRPISNQALLNKTNNSSYFNNIIDNQNLMKSNSNKKTEKKQKSSPSPSVMLSTFAHFVQNLNKNKKPLYSNLRIKSSKNKRNPQSNFEIRYIKKGVLTSNNSLTNINDISNNDNMLYSNNISFVNLTQYNNSTDYNKKTNKKIDYFDKSNNYNIPLSPDKTYNKNMNFLINHIYKRDDNVLNNIRNNIQTQSHQSENSQNILMTTQSTKKKNSFNSSKTEGEIKYNIINKKNKINNVITMNVNSPEELHFFYINVIQNGKKFAKKFEVSN